MDWLAKLKGCLRSLTIWFNGVMGTVIIALPFAQDNFPALETYLSHELYRYLMGAIVAINLLLRFKTKLPLEAK